MIASSFCRARRQLLRVVKILTVHVDRKIYKPHHHPGPDVRMAEHRGAEILVPVCTCIFLCFFHLTQPDACAIKSICIGPL